MIVFSPAPHPSQRPTRFPTPFDRGAVHPLAHRAAMEVIDALQAHHAAPWRLDDPGQGKMFGVLVVAAPDGTLGYLRAFSGMMQGTWGIDGWAPPCFDQTMYSRVWPTGEGEMYDFAAQRATLVTALRGQPRGGAADGDVGAWQALQALDQTRSHRSRELLRQLQDCYAFRSARGETRSLRALFAPAEPPGGAGDCAAPKLLAHAYRLGLEPLALAEFWWGAPSSTGDRRPGVFYAACRGKCLPILTHMLDGLAADPPPLFGSAAIDAAEPAVLYEDEQLLVVNKPSGLLSVPGRSALLQDSVLSRVSARYPDASGPLIVHRLDLDTSGVMLLAKDPVSASALQRLFSLREIEKQYVAWIDGEPAADGGEISLPLRVDVDDRPRQIHDPVHGKPAETGWTVLAREQGRTRVRFTPRTGRTHQLRVHAAHPQGLDAPILGDRLYGRTPPNDGERLQLHAERLAFVHPATGATIVVEQSAPF